MSEHAKEVFEKIRTYEPYMDAKLNALVDLCELLNSGLISEHEYFSQRERILRGDEEVTIDTDRA